MKEKNNELKILLGIAKILDDLEIPYYITGGFAVSIWGKPRFTADIDIIIKMSHFQKNDFANLVQKLLPKGYVDKTQINTALAHEGEFNIIDPTSGLKIDFWIAKKNEFEENCFKRRKNKDLSYKISFVSPEDLIISKLIWYKETGSNRHLEDIKTVIGISKIDQEYLKKWANKLDLLTELKKTC